MSKTFDFNQDDMRTAMHDTLSDGIDSMVGYTPSREELREIGCYLIGWFHSSVRRAAEERKEKEIQK